MKVIKKFARGDDVQQRDILETVLHASFSMVGVMNGQVTVFSRSNYLDGIEAKIFGGLDKELRVNRIQVHGKTASAHVSLVGPTMYFNHFMNLGESKDGWLLVNSAVWMKKKKKK